ncbi:LuxR C-terminal-related transcriptional regulator [Nocardioides carbamazepini]|uniref:LuxR C-terminal-related transcriptional regulator n=1 Tax=Nocardioides carbamazepini TaxID=2854259 RepID=UPI002149E5C5|nr:LuxR C-terminal-related transcriptional regulator [Nocardioides carbamazepini]MCR1786057.1 LuxR C-terminal-related transcriptional regulator [Nocardioides carbamazepini]
MTGPVLLARPRLHARLDQDEPRLVVLSAPSGSGKTSLVRCWVATRDPGEVVWVTLETDRVARTNFWQAVLTNAGRLGVLPTIEAAGLVDDVARTADLPALVAGALSARGPLVLVVDAHERLRDDTGPVDADLAQLARLCPELKVVVTTRTATGLASPGRTLRGEVELLTAADLAFTEDETHELLRTFAEPGVAERADGLHAATGGFPLAVRAGMLSLARATTDPATPDWQSLVAEDLRIQLGTGTVYDLVLATCLPPYFDTDLAIELTGTSDVKETLAELEWNGFGRWIPFAPGRQVFQYVESLRTAMLADTTRLPAATQARHARLAATWLYRNGNFETAFDVAVGARQYDVAGRVYAALVASNPETITTARFDRQLASVPSRALTQYPALALGRGLACHRDPATLGAAADYFRIPASWVGPPAPGSTPGEVLMVHTAKVASLRALGRFEDSGRAAQQALAHFDSIPDGEQHHVADLGATTLRHLGYSLFQDGQVEEARTAATRAITMSTRPETLNHTAVYAVGFNAIDGRCGEARAAQAHVDPAAWRPGQTRTYVNALGRIGQAALLLDDFDLTGAIAEYDDCAFVVASEFWPFVTWTLMHARLGLGHAATEAHRVEAALARTPTPPGTADSLGGAAVRATLAVLWLAAGNRTKAGPLLRTRTRYAGQLAPAVLLGRLLAGEAAEALGALPRLETQPGHTTRSTAAVLSLGAAAALRSERPDTAAALLDRVLAIVGPGGARAHLMYLPATDLAGLRALAAEQGDTTLRDYLAAPVPNCVTGEILAASLTPQERTVIAAFAQHPTRATAAAALHVSENTVKTHLQRIYRKLGVNSREAVIQKAIELDLLAPR